MISKSTSVKGITAGPFRNVKITFKLYHKIPSRKSSHAKQTLEEGHRMKCSRPKLTYLKTIFEKDASNEWLVYKHST